VLHRPLVVEARACGLGFGDHDPMLHTMGAWSAASRPGEWSVEREGGERTRVEWLPMSKTSASWSGSAIVEVEVD
jgi:hypothetical protein